MTSYTLKRIEDGYTDKKRFEVYANGMLLGTVRQYKDTPTRKIAGSRLVRTLKPRLSWMLSPSRAAESRVNRSHFGFRSKASAAETLVRLCADRGLFENSSKI